MRRLVTTIGTLIAAGAVAVAVPTSAQAATGTLTFYNVIFHDGSGSGPGVPYLNPDPGCYEVPREAHGPLSGVNNATDSTVRFYWGEDCTGGSAFSVSAGRWVRFNSRPRSFTVES
ncbi:hypothetical protein ACIPLC_30180 [Kitasatospora sp. NPDC086801]|uniref:hypothetical protein n=1 Tax=Kitasatospora sp. NPDC086801 TaxID=3364066 RepID=UPI003804F0E2